MPPVASDICIQQHSLIQRGSCLYWCRGSMPEESTLSPDRLEKAVQRNRRHLVYGPPAIKSYCSAYPTPSRLCQHRKITDRVRKQYCAVVCDGKKSQNRAGTCCILTHHACGQVERTLRRMLYSMVLWPTTTGHGKASA